MILQKFGLGKAGPSGKAVARKGLARNGFYLLNFSIGTAILLAGCAVKPQPDECCSFSHLAHTTQVEEDQGTLHVLGSTTAYYYVLDEAGKQVAYKLLNETLNLDPGRYTVRVNNSTHPVEIHSGLRAQCATGTLIVHGDTPESYYVMDSVRQQLGYGKLGDAMSLFPGSFRVRVNNTELPVLIRAKELTGLRTGTLVVGGTTNEYYYVLDDANKQLSYNTLQKPLAFFPGTYVLKVNNTSMKADVFAGHLTELGTGNLLIKGLTEEFYYVTDTLGNALNFQNLNKPLAFFPGRFYVKVNNTVVEGQVFQGKTTEFVTGSLMLTGDGTTYYYVLDENGNQLNYNILNRALSFFPSDYVIKLGSSTRIATVAAGELTAIDAFN